MDGKGKIVAGYHANALTNEVTLFVRDFGPGVSKEDIDKVFNPFFTTKTQGTGLGLAIAKKIAGLHRGEIVHNCPADGGAEFVVTIPII